MLSWLNYLNGPNHSSHTPDPASSPAHFGPTDGEYAGGLVSPWMSDASEKAFYPSNYSGPGAPAVQGQQSRARSSSTFFTRGRRWADDALLDQMAKLLDNRKI